MNTYQYYTNQVSQSINNQWPYLQSKNYNDWESIFQIFPHLKQINGNNDYSSEHNVNGIVIRSANDDNVHKAIKYGIWTTTPKNKSKIQQLWQRKMNINTNTYLFFSAVKSGMFEGVARLKSGYHQQTFPFWWQNHTLKFKGYFEIEWVYIKDINNKHFINLYNTEGQQVIKSKDCDTLDSQTTLKMLNIFDKKQAKRHIFNDFPYMDERESQYIRKMYQMTYYNNNYNIGYQNNNSFDFAQFSLVGHPINLIGNVNTNNHMLNIPPTLMRPGGNDTQQRNNVGFNNDNQQRYNFGFQMNPVSKNKKK